MRTIHGMEQALTGLHLRMAWCPYLYVCVQQRVSYRLDGEGAGDDARLLSSHAIGDDVRLQIRKEAEGILITWPDFATIGANCSSNRHNQFPWVTR
jgi:hypothetical protein